MLARITAFFMCVVSLFTTQFSLLFSEVELKQELKAGYFESPYIVRVLSEITVNGISVDEYTVTAPEGELYTLAAKTLQKELHKVSGKDIAISENDTDKAFIITKELNDKAIFTLKAENGNI